MTNLSSTYYGQREVLGKNNFFSEGALEKNAPEQFFCLSASRYGFNGQEKDDEVNGVTGSSYTAEYWQYDSRLGRRWNIDPVDKPWMSSYHAFSNKPIWNVDPNGAEDNEYNVDGKTGEKTFVNKNGGSKIDYNHMVGGDNDGKTEIVENSSGESTWMSTSEFMRGYTNRGKDDSGHEVDYKDIFEEFDNGTGPEKSLVYGFSRMNLDIMASPQMKEAYGIFQNKGGEKRQVKTGFGPIGAYKSGFNMTAQMIGKANISFYPVGNTLVIMIVDSKSISSWSLNPFAKGEENNIPRVNGIGGPESTTHQTYMFHIPLTSDPAKIAK